ncbi:S41 family peptidase [Blastomonas marina]|uniref:Peptidase S41 n=1 Tax=Blastomonas marina TaxID=1867408 RepID=A0ABQ1FHR1_9SPHN|nr:S41 family peptidase [Blastomonas marina]WPZ03462.1 S41 family peptidase [Blastomonas marina]GGA12123.1 peptidase S41 [Blastomonas marina]
MKKKFASLARASALVGAVALLPATTAGLAQVDARTSSDFARLFEIYEMVKSNYVEGVDDEQLIRGAIDGMLASLDPHSGYLDGTAIERLNTLVDGEYQGLGLSVVSEDGAVKVISPFKGSPADEMGIKAGDYITHLDGKSIIGWELDEAVAKMRGPEGTDIQLTIFRAGREDTFDVTVTRGRIQLEPVTYEIEGTVGVISINEFSRDVGIDVAEAIDSMRRDVPGGKLTGLVLDMRNNPGGSLREAVILSDLFLTEGTIVSQKGRREEDNRTFPAELVFRGEITPGLPMIVLINAGSASASEIVAGALQDQRRALVMGERSFGKGSVQSLFYLDDDRTRGLKLTTARYYTPAGKSVQEGGINPDIRVPQLSDPDAARRARLAFRESDLRGHLINEIDLDERELENDRKADPRFEVTAEELEAQGIEDFQLDYAIKTLNRTSNPVGLARRK